MGVSVRQVRKKLSESRARAAAGLPLRPRDIPLPAQVTRRKVWNGHHDVTATSPQWREAAVAAWMAQRPGQGAKGVPRPRRAAS
jgi:hypothetical protein